MWTCVDNVCCNHNSKNLICVVFFLTVLISLFVVVFHSVPTGLLALQGNDEEGSFIRSKLKKMGVATEFIKSQLLFFFIFLNYLM